MTPLQMALVAATVANGGDADEAAPRHRDDRPRRDAGRSRRRADGRGHRPDEAAAIAAAMQRAVESAIGRQFTSGAKVPGVPTAGKSGTAELGGSGAPHSWFIGFAPVDHPRVAIAVIVERGGRGGARAAPLAGDLHDALLQDVRPVTERRRVTGRSDGPTAIRRRARGRGSSGSGWRRSPS